MHSNSNTRTCERIRTHPHILILILKHTHPLLHTLTDSDSNLRTCERTRTQFTEKRSTMFTEKQEDELGFWDSNPGLQ